ncbi:sensor histidine kinase [Salinicola socius]|nr:two-component regulator propeller domain-containing protein [Salinicola socius]
MKPALSAWLNVPMGRSAALWLWWIWLMPVTALALDSNLTLQQLHHRSWSGTAEENGPGQVGAIAQTSDGYLWLGTHYSLFRFDGNAFERYATTDGKTVATVSSLLSIPGGGLWVGLRRGGVSLIRDGELTDYGPGSGFPTGAVYGLAQDHDGDVWAAANDGLARFDGVRWHTVSTDWGFPGNNARAVFVDRNGTLWAASESRLFYLPRGSHRFLDADQPVGWVSQITQTRDGTLWIAELHPGRVRPILFSGEAPQPLDVVSAGLAADRDGNLWIGTQGEGLLRLPDAGHNLSTSTNSLAAAVQHYGHLDGLSADDIEPVFEDAAGNVWVGTSAGLDRFRHATLVPADLPGGARNIALAEEASGMLWAGSSNRPLMHRFAGRWHTSDVPPPITSAFSDAKGDVWLGGPNGIWRAHRGVLRRVTALPPTAQAEASVRAMARDGDGALWVSINRSGLFRWYGEAWQLTSPPTTHPSQTMPVSATSDAQGRVWFGYRDDLLVMRDGDDVRQWGRQDGLDIGNVAAISATRQHLWLGGTNGAALFDGKRFHAIASGGPFTGIHAIIETPAEIADDHLGDSPAWGDLWLHTQTGVLQIPAGEITRVLGEPGYRVRFRRFEGDDDLPNDAFRIHPVPSAIQGRDGRLWFATVTGVVSVDPSRTQARSPPPEPRLTALSADTSSYPLASPIASQASLSARPRRIAIDYTAIDLSRPESVRFRYRLRGYDTRWHDAGHRRQAIYTRLGPGDYRFEVEASSSSGVWNPRPASLSLHIAPAFYQTWTFRGLCLLIISVLLWVGYRYRMRLAAAQLRARLEARHAERERIARELHDTLLQSIQALVLHFQAAADRMPIDDPARQAMARALDRADEVIDEGRDRVMSLHRASADTGLAERLARASRERPDARYPTCHVTTQGNPKPLRTRVENEAYWIGHEALCNALHHADATRITVTLCHAPDGFSLSVSDDGTGIPGHYLTPSGRPGHWGLPHMQERARQLGGNLELDSQAGLGTTVRLTVPAALAYRYHPSRHHPSRRRRWRFGRT